MNEHTRRKVAGTILLAAVISVLAGCGGGGGRGGSAVTPPPPPAAQNVTIGGTVSGLLGTVVLRNNGGDSLTLSATGSFTFATPATSGSAYNVTVATQPVLQSCTATSATGTATANVATVAVNCVNNAFPAALTFQSIKTFRFTWTAVPGASHYRLLEDRDGASGFTPVGGNIAADATSYDHVVPLFRRVNARYVVQVCDGTNCVDSSSLAVTGTLAQAIGYVKASNTGASDFFGTGVALSDDGNTLAVTANLEDSNATGIDGVQSDDSALNSGAVYIFTRSASGWSQQAYVKASNTEANDEFGRSLALSGDGNTLAVGASLEDSSATGIGGDQSDNSALGSGAVYVFARAGDAWSQQAYVKASNTGTNDRFGISVALSADGNTLAVGALDEDSNATGVGDDDDDESAPESGAVYVFTRTDTSWSQQAYIKASNTSTDDGFGEAVALCADGNTLAIGATYEDSNAVGIGGNQNDNSAPDSGALYVFIRTGGIWSQQAYIKASNTGSADAFGSFLALSADGDTVAVGTPFEDSSATGIGGAQSDNSASNAGAVYVLSRSSGTWSQQAYIKASNTEASDRFATTIDLSADGNTLAVGATDDDSSAIGLGGNDADNSADAGGAVFVFTRSSGIWSQQAYVKASNTEADDTFASVTLSGDGNTLAVGASAESSGATGIGGDQASNSVSRSGAVYLY